MIIEMKLLIALKVIDNTTVLQELNAPKWISPGTVINRCTKVHETFDAYLTKNQKFLPDTYGDNTDTCKYMYMHLKCSHVSKSTLNALENLIDDDIIIDFQILKGR